MNLSRLPPLLLPLAAWAGSGCTGQRRDTGHPSDSYFTAEFSLLVNDGSIIDAMPDVQEGQRSTVLTTLYEDPIDLYGDAYWNAEPCWIEYRVGGSAGTSFPGAWRSFTITPVHYTGGVCERLGDDLPGSLEAEAPWLFTEATWELTFEPVDDALVDVILDTLDREAWTPFFEDRLFGVGLYIDGVPVDSALTMYGTGYAFSGAELLVDEIAAGVDGYYQTHAVLLNRAP